MSVPKFTATASLFHPQEPYQVTVAFSLSASHPDVVPQLSFGFGGGGVTGPAYPEEMCDYCVQWIRLPCGLF
jgi:hypothetical protein